MNRWTQLRRNAGWLGIARGAFVMVVMSGIAVAVAAGQPDGWLVLGGFLVGLLAPLPLQGLLAARPAVSQWVINGWALLILLAAVFGRELLDGTGNLGLAGVVGFVVAYLSTWFLFMSHPEVVILHDRR